MPTIQRLCLVTLLSISVPAQAEDHPTMLIPDPPFVLCRDVYDNIPLQETNKEKGSHKRESILPYQRFQERLYERQVLREDSISWQQGENTTERCYTVISSSTQQPVQREYLMQQQLQ